MVFKSAFATQERFDLRIHMTDKNVSKAVLSIAESFSKQTGTSIAITTNLDKESLLSDIKTGKLVDVIISSDSEFFIQLKQEGLLNSTYYTPLFYENLVYASVNTKYKFFDGSRDVIHIALEQDKPLFFDKFTKIDGQVFSDCKALKNIDSKYKYAIIRQNLAKKCNMSVLGEVYLERAFTYNIGIVVTNNFKDALKFYNFVTNDDSGLVAKSIKHENFNLSQ